MTLLLTNFVIFRHLFGDFDAISADDSAEHAAILPKGYAAKIAKKRSATAAEGSAAADFPTKVGGRTRWTIH